jgi:hypothetical protein
VFRSFEEARKFVHALRLKNRDEWAKYCKGELAGYEAKPNDIPTNSRQTYRDQGWRGWGDWFGTGTIAVQ